MNKGTGTVQHSPSSASIRVLVLSFVRKVTMGLPQPPRGITRNLLPWYAQLDPGRGGAKWAGVRKRAFSSPLLITILYLSLYHIVPRKTILPWLRPASEGDLFRIAGVCRAPKTRTI